MHHDIVERAPMDIQSSSVEAIHNVGANMEVSSLEENVETSKNESILTPKRATKKQYKPVPVQVNKVILTNDKNHVANNNNTPSSSIAKTAIITPTTVSPLKTIIVQKVPKEITVTPVRLPKVASPTSKQFVKIAPQPQVISTPVQIQLTPSGNVARIIQYPHAGTPITENALVGSIVKTTSNPCLDCGVSPKPVIAAVHSQINVGTDMKAIERKFFKHGPIHKRRSDIASLSLSRTKENPPQVTSSNTTVTVCTSTNEVNKSVVRSPQPVIIRKRSRSYNTRRNEPECLTISSDDDDSSGSKDSTPKKEKIQVKMANRFQRLRDKDGTLLPDSSPTTFIQLQCRSIRIGSYKISPELAQPITIQKEKITITVPSIGDQSQSVNLHILEEDILNVLAHLGRTMPAIFIYTTEGCAGTIRSMLGMTKVEGYYFNPFSPDESQKRITILPVSVDESHQQFLRNSFLTGKLTEIDHKVANMILVRSTAGLLNFEENQKNDAVKSVANRLSFLARNVLNPNQAPPAVNVSPAKSIETLITYPPPPQTGGISVTSEDLECLKEGEFLNDVIIDFYLKYLVNEVLSKEDRQRTHVFSSFFYPCLTQKAVNRDIFDNPLQTPSERRHRKVKTWTRHVDIFEKDFIIIPINQRAHWFLAIICFPGLVPESSSQQGTPTPPVAASATNEESPNPNQTETVPVNMQHSVILHTFQTEEDESNDLLASQLSLGAEEFAQEEDSMQCDDQSYSEDQEDPFPPTQAEEHPICEQIPLSGVIKRPCILIFDSLMGPSRWRIMSALREYLTVEWKVRKGTQKIFSKTSMVGFTAHVPQQTNYSDCGIYLLQYVESFFENPIRMFYQPMNLKEWFPPERVTRKRTEIRELIQRLRDKQRQTNASEGSTAVKTENEVCDAKSQELSAEAELAARQLLEDAAVDKT